MITTRLADHALPHAVLAAFDALPARIEEVTANSREARAGFAFLAYPGVARDGRDFIGDALTRGASAVLFDDDHFSWRNEWKVPHLGVASLKLQASLIAGHVYGAPSDALWMIGVTGTNGKTSVAQWVAQALDRAGRRTAVLGTIGNGLVGQLSVSDNTTPDAILLQRLLRSFRDAGAQSCAMEVSSHGLDQGRVADIKYDVAIFTNLTRDHLDYHGTMEAYGAAKAKLFSARGLQHAVVNVDDAFGRTLASRVAATGIRVTRFACAQGRAEADLIGENIELTAQGLRFMVRDTCSAVQVESGVIGAFNVSNLLAVMGALQASGFSLQEAAKAVSALAPVPGRMQTLRVPAKPLVVIDYAHTPDALEKALSTVKATLPKGARLISVFGCGGDRDKGKRPQMGAISAKWADHTIVTSDNPRTESPARILADIEPGLAGTKHQLIVDRQQAIYEALNEARVNDIVVIAGKGHEDYQIIADTKHHFSDVEIATEALTNWRGR